MHDDKVEKLPVTVNNDGTLLFETDKFSTYALAYDDVKKVTNTGDNTNILGYSVLALTSLVLLVELKKRKFKTQLRK